MILIFLILCWFSFVAFGQTEKSIREIKDVSDVKQDEIIFYRWNSNPTMKNVKDTSAKVREFIWEHWKFQKQGTVKREVYSKEGEQTITTYNVKCSENNSCELFVKIESEVVGRGKYKSKKSINITEYTTKSVNRIEVPNDYLEKRKSIDESKKVSDKNFWIQLKDEKENIISEI